MKQNFKKLKSTFVRLRRLLQIFPEFSSFIGIQPFLFTFLNRARTGIWLGLKGQGWISRAISSKALKDPSSNRPGLQKARAPKGPGFDRPGLPKVRALKGEDSKVSILLGTELLIFLHSRYTFCIFIKPYLAVHYYWISLEKIFTSIQAVLAKIILTNLEWVKRMALALKIPLF